MAHLMLDRQVLAIYENIENGAVKLALEQLAKAHKKQKTLPPVYNALKALALARADKDEDEAHALCDQLLALKPVDDQLLTVLEKALYELDRPFDVTTLFDEAYKNQKDAMRALSLGEQAFCAHTKFGNWRNAQQVANKMYKTTQDARHAYWAAMSAVLQSTDPATPSDMRPVLLKLALRIIELCRHPSWIVPDRLILHVDVLQALGRTDDAVRLLDETMEGQEAVDRNQRLTELRHELRLRSGQWKEEGDHARDCLVGGQRNPDWDTILLLIDRTMYTVAPPPAALPVPELTGEQMDALRAAACDCVDVLNGVVQCAQLTALAQRIAREDAVQAAEDEEEDGKPSFFAAKAEPARRTEKNWRAETRTGLLGKLELQARLDAFGVRVVDRAEVLGQFAERLGMLASAFDDVVTHVKALLEQDGEEAARRLEEALKPLPEDVDTEDALLRTMTKLKLLRALQSPEGLTEEGEVAAGKNYAEVYAAALELGKDLDPERDIQPADDLALMSGQAFISAWQVSDNPSHLLPALCILERASAASRKSHILRLHLVRVYRLLGCGASLAIAHYITLGSAVQPGGMAHDGVAYNVVARASTFAFAVKAEDEDLQFEKPGMLTGGGAARMMQLCGEANMMYRPYLEHTADAVITAFAQEKYGQIQDLLKLEARVDNSLQRDLNQFEYARMALLWTELPDGPTLELFEAELIDMKLTFERGLHVDNRDFDVLPSFQPMRGDSFEAQTCLGGHTRSPGVGWIRAFLKLYLRALATPEHLNYQPPGVYLIGTLGAAQPEHKTPVAERIQATTEEELNELTPDERALVSFVDEVLAWFERRRQERGGSATEEHSERIVQSFEDGVARCEQLLSSDQYLPWEIMHAVTIIYERYVLFNAISTRDVATLAGPGKPKSKKRSYPAQVQQVRSRLRTALLRLPHLLLERSRREDGLTLAAQCDPVKQWVHIPSVVDRLAEARRLAFEGLAQGLLVAVP